MKLASIGTGAAGSTATPIDDRLPIASREKVELAREGETFFM